jgi:hypothetical protein
MTLKSYRWGIRISAILSFAAWALIVWYVDPTKAGLAGLVLFYGSAFLFLSATFILFFTWLRGSAPSEEAHIYLALSFRQGILMSLLTVCLLVLQQARFLRWWDGLLVVAGFLLIELNFLTKK